MFSLYRQGMLDVKMYLAVLCGNRRDYSQPISREVFFVSGAQRKSQKTRGLRRETAFFAVSVHRAACYWARSEQ